MARVLLSAVFALLLMLGAVQAQTSTNTLLTEIESKIEDLQLKFKTVESVIGTEGVTDEQLAQQRTAIDALNLEADVEAKKIAGPLNDLEAQLSRLGPAPEAGTNEPPPIANQRRILDGRMARLLASQKQLELLKLEANQAVTRVLTLQRDQFFDRIFRSDKSVLNPGLWLDTFSSVGVFGSRVMLFTQNWWREVSGSANFGGLLLFPLGLAFIYVIWRYVVRWLAERLRMVRGPATEGEVRQMTPMTRLLRVISGMIAVLLLVFVGAVLFSGAMELAGLTTSRTEPLIGSWVGLVSVIVVNFALTYLVCAPKHPEARLIAIDDKSARALPLLVAAATFAKSVTEVFSSTANILNLPVNLTAGQTAIASGAMIVLLGLILIILRKQADRGLSEGKSYYLTWFVQVLPVIWLLLGVSVLALILGYISLAYFITGNVLDTALIGILFAIVHYLADAISDYLINPATRAGNFLRARMGFSEKGVARLALIFRTAIDVLLFLLAIPALFIIWTVTWINFSSLRTSFVNGFQIGNITLSPWGILVAVAVLAIGIAITRTLTGWLQRRVLSETTLDKGVQDSIRTASSYLGYILAAALALSVAGIDFSNIAIVAGALGVGIGFGLQSIVNNFVSGLILLAERPIRVGDWVETDKGDGIVKKINVRSTEIETFDSCTVFIPNSTLITQSVKNWTHRDTVGRMAVNVQVDYAHNADKVRETLLEIVKQHPKILRYPEPSVQLAKFGAQGFEFDIRGFVADVFEAGRVASDIRLAIARTFEAKKIKIAKA